MWLLASSRQTQWLPISRQTPKHRTSRIRCPMNRLISSRPYLQARSEDGCICDEGEEWLTMRAEFHGYHTHTRLQLPANDHRCDRMFKRQQTRDDRQAQRLPPGSAPLLRSCVRRNRSTLQPGLNLAASNTISPSESATNFDVSTFKHTS